MPMVSPQSAWEAWLHVDSADGASALGTALEASLTQFDAYPVLTYVNSPHNQGEECIRPASQPCSDTS